MTFAALFHEVNDAVNVKLRPEKKTHYRTENNQHVKYNKIRYKIIHKYSNISYLTTPTTK